MTEQEEHQTPEPPEEASSAPATTPGEVHVPATKGAPVTQQVGRLVMIVAAVLFGVFAVFNFQYVDFNWVVGGTEVVDQGGERVSGGVPLILLLTAAFGLGLLVGVANGWRTRRQLKKQLKGR